MPIAVGNGLMSRVSDDYCIKVILPWGDPHYSGSQEIIGIGRDGMWYFPLEYVRGRHNQNGVQLFNHEFCDNAMVIGKDVPVSLEEVRESQYTHGVPVIEIERRPSNNMNWRTVNENRLARRILVNTPVEFSGPAAGSAFLQNTAGNIPMGTVNNCGNGYTPWGTYLTCEKNFNGGFGGNGNYVATLAQACYGLSSGRFGYGWHLFDERFDLTNPDYANEANRFGKIVEIDPYRPNTAPVKRRPMGRFKHKGCALVIGKDDRAAGYMGDDERFDCIYKYVSNDSADATVARGESPLDDGRLYVARFNDDGTGDWLELTINDPAMQAAGFNSQAKVLVYARLAADAVGATLKDRPEWTTIGADGYCYCTLTNNSRRTEPNAANSLAPSSDGHIYPLTRQ